ncbi:tryptophan synthase beta subunit-like PLP-dependent enzyme [Patellaria atrata CBS 101060]|uniref:Tryptophan synthase beta subunit-like PLP-dependent enzyme n=1 Tax=Patellaria atrata CBS 101060 TaxID=1346257 RepID=A0A9P4SH68_9PEZI|nr:tryptophan synthase beta subunit-like PLP-dependent enzyme [Patellaria atrata CBS 101060]
MAASNPLNVFRGPNSMAQYFDPDQNPPLPLVEIPAALNPLRKDGVRIYAKMLTALPAQNVKSLPGSTVLSLGMISRALWDNEDVVAHVTNKKHVDSLRLLRFFGLKVSLYGGLAQQEPQDPKGIMSRLRALASTNPGVCYPGQYDNIYNWKSHEQWTGAQIWKQLPEIDVFCATIGTGGCATGTGVYLKSKKPSVKVVGVCNEFGDPTPGPRHFPGFESSQFPWRETIDVFESVASCNAYRSSMNLCRYGIIAGPSSGEALHGILAYLRNVKEEGRLAELANPSTGEISCVFICADLPYQYMDMYFKKLGDEEFPPIYNKCLLGCDLDPYDERWFLSPDQVAALISHASNTFRSESYSTYTKESLLVSATTLSSVSSASSVSTSSSHPSMSSSYTYLPSIYGLTYWSQSDILTIIDIRNAVAYTNSHIRGSLNLPLPDIKKDLFGVADSVKKRWLELKTDNGQPRLVSETIRNSPKKVILFVCQDGDTARMATAMLRAEGCEAFCADGGYDMLSTYLQNQKGLANIVDGQSQLEKSSSAS